MAIDFETDMELARAFEKKHSAFLKKLEEMPAGGSKGEEREERLKLFRQYPMRDDFQMEAMRAYRRDAYERFMDRVNPEKEWRRSLDEGKDMDIASVRNRKDIDPYVFTEAINEAVCGYTGKTKSGGDYNFLACVGQNYKQMAGRKAAKYDLDERGISDSEIPERNLYRVLRLVRDRNAIAQREGYGESPEKILDIIQDVLQKDYTKKEQELIRTLVFDNVFKVSIDEGAEDDDGEAFVFSLADQKNDVKEAEEREMARGLLNTFCENIERKWALIDSGKGLREKKTIQLFFSANILKELKLDDEGEPYPTEPAGDEDFYLILKPKGDFLYRELLHKEYLWRALTGYPNDFYEVYAKLLREDFKFSDTVIAKLVGKNKSTISRERKEYVELVKVLCDFCE